ncbi:hypothetical protein IW262DRAFT_1455273 [Armillaria fumosa]|nr:hypothetical protein IW262DRAFT_1455273 [Armillaria fumosa]
MPVEWNMMVGEMWEIDPMSQGSLFNYPEFPGNEDPSPEINDRLSFIIPNANLEFKGPYEFKNNMYPDVQRREFLRSTIVIHPETDEHIATMLAANESRNHRAIHCSDPITLRVNKGKQKMTEAHNDDDIEWLRQHWYKDYEELLQGVPEGMPPWRVVNHEIPLDDNNTKYHYHLPRCPNAL